LQKTGEINIITFDCIEFMQHFPHLFHRIQTDYLGTYQALVLDEPYSSVGPTLQEAFPGLHQTAGGGERIQQPARQ